MAVGAPLRVCVPDDLGPWAPLIRSGWRVWSSIHEHLSRRVAEGIVIVGPDDDPDVIVQLPHGVDPPRDDVPVVAIIHEAPSDEVGSPELAAEVRRIGRELVGRSARVVTCSSFSRRQIAEEYGYPIESIDVALYGVDPSTFRPDGPTAEDQIHAAGGDDRPYVLFVGSVLPRKNLPLLRRAMEELPSHQLVIVAGPCFHPRSDELVAEAGEPIGGRPVANLYGVDDRALAALMRGADVLCLPSASEGFGLPVAEAMACGTPVVVSNRGSLPEVAGRGGVTVEPTVDGIVTGIREVIARRSDHAEQALARAAELTWERTAEVVHDSLLRALGRTSSGPDAPTAAAPIPVFAIDRCPVCGHDGGRDIQLGDHQLRECAGCSLTYARTGAAPEHIYTDAYLTGDSRFGIDTTNPILRVIAQWAAARRLDLVEETMAPGTLLDVGCGAGELLQVAASRGWDALGIDPVPASVARAIADGLHARVGDLDRDPGLVGFDLVTASHVIEHMPDPVTFLRRLAGRCRPGGIVLVEVPNWACPEREEQGADWEHLRPLEHLMHFTPETLAGVFVRAGLDPQIATVTVSADVPELEAKGQGFAVVGWARVGEAAG